MARLRTLAVFGIAFVASAGHAFAQSANVVAEQRAAQAETPWFEAFTFSRGPTETMTGLGPSGRTAQPALTLADRWGITVDLGAPSARVQAAPPAPGREAERAVGAFFQFTPRVRVGGEVSVTEPSDATRPAARAAAGAAETREPTAGVRLESAFRF